MTDKARDFPAGGRKPEGERSARRSEAPVTKRETEAVRPTFSDLNAMKQKSDVEVAHKVVSGLLARHTKKQPLPSRIVRFLGTHWRLYVQQLYLREGGQSEAWHKALKNTENLIWSLQPKRDDESRRRLYDLLPELFQWVHAVLKSQQVPVSEEDQFFADLAKMQVAALHAEREGPVAKLAPGAAPPEAVAGDPPANEIGDAESGIATEPEPTDETDLRPEKQEQAKSSRRPESGPLRDLVIGAYVEFKSERAANRIMRLEWISGNAGVYMFRDQKKGDSLCLTADRCIQCLRERTAVVLR